jgi:hypothetical protein
MGHPRPIGAVQIFGGRQKVRRSEDPARVSRSSVHDGPAGDSAATTTSTPSACPTIFGIARSA